MGFVGLVLIAACDGPSEEEALGDYFERQAAVVETAARALQADDCDLAINTLNARSTPRLYPVASAVLRIDGRCLDRNYAMAARLLTEEASLVAPDPVALARLGSLHETGEGVEQDEAKALSYHRHAIAAMGPVYFRLQTEEASKHAEQDLDPDTLTEEDRELLEEPARFRELKAALERHRTDDDFGPLWDCLRVR